ncbi:MAG: hypothetical protein KKB59_20250 [Spirochaetes bacterium]|nr:hypothetical protein [Spirochaetota bacterium]
MKHKYIPCTACAEKLGINKFNFHKYLSSGKFGNIKIVKIRLKEKNNQNINHISIEDYESIKNFREVEGFGTNKTNGGVIKNYFYIVQTNPNKIPERYKFGVTNNIKLRLQSYKTICPNVKSMKYWECFKSLEKPLEGMIFKNSKRVGQEVFETKQLGVIVDKIEQVLEIL